MRTFVILLLATATASADPPKYVRKTQLHIDVKTSERTKPIQPVKTDAHKPVDAGDALVLLEHADPIRKEQEQLLLDLIRDTPDTDPDKPDYMFRLAEQYAMQQRMWRLKAVEITMPDRH
jgi:hypothetical protein